MSLYTEDKKHIQLGLIVTAIPSGSSEEMSDRERIAQAAHQKWGNEWITLFWANRSFAHFWAKNERFAWKTDERIPSPGCSTRRMKDRRDAGKKRWSKGGIQDWKDSGPEGYMKGGIQVSNNLGSIDSGSVSATLFFHSTLQFRFVSLVKCFVSRNTKHTKLTFTC